MGIFSKKQSDAPRRRNAIESDSLKAPTMSSSFKKNVNLNRFDFNQTSSPRGQHHHLSLKRRKLASILLVAVAIIALLTIIIYQFTATVSIRIENSSILNNVDKLQYQNIVQDYLNANPLSRLRFILDDTKLNDFVSSKLSEVETIAQDNSVGLGATQFTLSLRKPVASWKINDEQYYVDASGVAFKNNYYNEPSVKIVDNSGAVVKDGEASISKRFLSFVGKIVALVSSSGFTVQEATLPENTTRQLNIGLAEPTVLIKMTIDRSAADQVDDMSRAVEHFKSQGSLPSYIDVRIDDKAFYK